MSRDDKKKHKKNKDKKEKTGKKAKKAKARLTPAPLAIAPPDPAPPETQMLMPDHEAAHRHLELARARWENGDWARLLEMDMATLEADPDRARLALILAAAQSHAGDMGKARELAGLALRWGAGRELAARVLLSSAQNSLGRVAAALREDPLAHFEAAIRLVQPHSDAPLLARNRRVRELAGLGLLPEAAGMLQQELGILRSEGPAGDPARLDRIEAQMAEVLALTARQPGRETRKKPRVQTVVVAGVPRSGSTWVYNATRLLLAESGRKVYACWQADYQPQEHEEADVHLVKVHGPDELRFPYDLILTTKRDIVERLASRIRMGWLKQEAEAVRAAKTVHEGLYTFWSQRSDLEIDFETITNRPERALQEIAALLEIPCTPKFAAILVRKLEAIEQPKAGAPHDPLTQLHPGHRSDGTETQRLAEWIRGVL